MEIKEELPLLQASETIVGALAERARSSLRSGLASSFRPAVASAHPSRPTKNGARCVAVTRCSAVAIPSSNREPHLHGVDDAGRDFVLDGEDVGRLAIESL